VAVVAAVVVAGHELPAAPSPVMRPARERHLRGVSTPMKSERVGDVCPALSPAQIQRGLSSGRFRMTDLGLEKLCSRCDEYYPADTEFWYYQPSSRQGLNNYCHACYREVTGRLSRASEELLKDQAEGAA
jgi:hypothetical protein